MAKTLRKIWGGIVAYEDDDVPSDLHLFNNVGKSATFWLLQSRELYRSALCLVEERARVRNEVTHLLQAPIALMLGAYAIETLLKMVIVGAHCDMHGHTFGARRADQFLPKTHNLLKLADQAKLRVNERDRKLLRNLGEYSIWAGRYPIPLMSDGYVGPALFEAINRAPAPVAKEHPTWPKFRALYPKLFKLAMRKTFRGRGFVLKPTA
jgi:hypothetical protein